MHGFLTVDTFRRELNEESSMQDWNRAWPVIGMLGACASLVSACQAPLPTRQAVAARPVAKASADAGPVGLMGRPGVALLRGAAPPPPVVQGRAVAAGATLVSAARGGRVVSNNGSAAVEIPPGALDRDALVTVESLSTAGLPAGPGHRPATRFRLDLGGAAVRPGMSLRMSGAVEAPVAAGLLADVGREQLGALGLAQDPDGRLIMTASVRGPAPAGGDPAAFAAAAGAWFVEEFGALPLPPEAAAPRRLLAVDAPLLRIPARMPTDFREFYRLENEGFWSCDIAQAMCMIDAVAALSMNGKPWDPATCGLAFVGTDPTPTPTPTLTPATATAAPKLALAGEPLPLSAVVRWTSDDPALDGRPVAGARVRFRLGAAPGRGPDEVMTDAAGRATTIAPPGARVFPQAVAPGEGWSGPAIEGVAGTGELALTLPAMSPVILLRLDGSRALPRRLKLRYALGDAEPVELEVENRSELPTQALIDLPVPLPAGSLAAAAIRLLDVDPGDGRMADLPAGVVQITRNGVYPLHVVVGAPPPK